MVSVMPNLKLPSKLHSVILLGLCHIALLGDKKHMGVNNMP